MFNLIEYSYATMNETLLRTFLAIAEARNLNRAAEQLHVTQSTISARLNSLEDALGQKLFHRKKNGTELTSAGFKFARYARLMTNLWRQARQETSLPEKVESVCNIGCHPDLWTELGHTLIQHISTSQPNVALSAWQSDQTTLTHWLSNELIDAAICYTPTLKEGWTSRILYRDRLLLVSTKPRSLMRWDPHYVYVDCGEAFRMNHAASYPEADTPLTTFGCPQWALDHLILNGGSAYLPERLIKMHLKNKQLYVVEDAAEFSRTAYVVLNSGRTSSWSWLPEFIDSLEC